MTGFRIVLAKKKETKGTWQYQAEDSKAQISTLYVKKSGLPLINKAERIVLNVSVDTDDLEGEGIVVLVTKTKETKGTWVYSNSSKTESISSVYVKKMGLALINKSDTIRLTVTAAAERDVAASALASTDVLVAGEDSTATVAPPSAKKRKKVEESTVSFDEALEIYLPLLDFYNRWMHGERDEAAEYFPQIIVIGGDYDYQNPFGEDGTEMMCNAFAKLPKMLQKKMMKTKCVKNRRPFTQPLPLLDESGEQTGDEILASLDTWLKTV